MLLLFVLIWLCFWRPVPGYGFDSTLLTKYNHMSFGGPPVTVETAEEAEDLMRIDEKESAIGKLSPFAT